MDLIRVHTLCLGANRSWPAGWDNALANLLGELLARRGGQRLLAVRAWSGGHVCLPCAVLGPGLRERGAVCTACAAGRAPSDDNQRCEGCAAGRHSPRGHACTACGAGSVPTTELAAVNCVVCPVGRTATGAAVRCAACDSGHVSAAAAGRCKPCANGSTPDESASACRACGRGRAGRGGTCDGVCGAGERVAMDRTACEPCPAGSHGDGEACVACGAGQAVHPMRRDRCVAFGG